MVADTGIAVDEHVRRASLAIDIGMFRHAGGERELLLGTHGALSVAYAPFEHVNEGASIIIVGLTPGRQQAANALEELQRSTGEGALWDDALAAAKVHASFSGPMRVNLIAMLDAIGVAGLLGIPTCADLFGTRTDLAHFTSALRYPVFVNGANYGGSPAIIKTPWLLEMAELWLARELASLPSAYVVPLGARVHDVIEHLVRRDIVDGDRVLGELPHPSGANAERIAYFLERKAAGMLSSRTDATRIDAARRSLAEKVERLRERTISKAQVLAQA